MDKNASGHLVDYFQQWDKLLAPQNHWSDSKECGESLEATYSKPQTPDTAVNDNGHWQDERVLHEYFGASHTTNEEWVQQALRSIEQDAPIEQNRELCKIILTNIINTIIRLCSCNWY